MFRALLIILKLVAPANASTEISSFWDGNDLLQECDSPDKTECYSYDMGIVDARLGAHEDFRVFCLPEGATAETVANIAAGYMKASPSILERNAAVNIPISLATIHPAPCR